MKSKRKTIRILTLFLTVTLMITGIGGENVSAFWNQDNFDYGDVRNEAHIKIQLMHCNHSDQNDSQYSKHYDSNGNHLNYTTGDTEIKKFEREPNVNGDLKAGTMLPDTNKYIYEYEMSYAESEQVDYAVITQPEITHYSDSERAKYKGLKEEHVRMYWTGTYENSISKLEDKWSVISGIGTAVNKPGDGIDWWDFKYEAFPSVNTSLSQQTWETVGDHEAFQDKKSFVMTQKYGENGQQFLYLLEGTKMVGSDGEFYDITSDDTSSAASNHRDQSHTGIPLGYGGHVNAIIGIVFYRTVSFDANGGTLTEGSLLNMQVYNGSNKGKLYTWYSDKSKRKWYSNINITSPQATTPYGTASVKNPTRTGYIFKGWYAPELDGLGNPVTDVNDNVICSDIPIYDTDGRAVLTYTDSSGQTQTSPYFDSNGNWIYKGNVTAYAKWEDVGSYTLHYEKGESNNYINLPVDTNIAVGTGSVKLADGKYIVGSDYIVDFKVSTNNGNQAASVVQPVTGHFPFYRWKIDGKLYPSGETYSNSNVVKGDIITATAVYGNIEVTLPTTSCESGYAFAGWYTSYDENTQTFSGYVGKAGDKLTVSTSANTVSMKFFAKWVKTDKTLAFDYNVPDTAAKSDFKYVLSGDEVKSKTVQHDSPLGDLPHPMLTGYKLSVSDISDGWSKFPNRSDGTQVENPVTAQTIYDSSYNTLYAQWQPIYYSIKYELNGGSVPASNPTEANYYKEITIYSPSRNGSTFLGWSITDMDGNEHIIDGKHTNTGLTSYSGVGKDKKSINVIGLRADTGTVTLTALWQDTSYNISYDYNANQQNCYGFL